MISYIEKIDNILNRFLLIIGGIAILLLMGLATANVVLRLFGRPYEGTYEIVSFLGAIVIALSLGYTQKRKGHIVVDILTERFSRKTNRILDIVNYFITMIFFIVVTWQVYVLGMKIWESGEVSETLKIIYYPFILAVAAGFAVFSLTLLVDFLKTVFSREGV